jgi:hypothetical protein
VSRLDTSGIAITYHVSPSDDNSWRVSSLTGDEVHIVTLDPLSCTLDGETCLGFKHGVDCIHIKAVRRAVVYLFQLPDTAE